MSSACLAMAWYPRGEGARFERFYSSLQAIYSHIVVAIPTETDAETRSLLRKLPDLTVIDYGWQSGRHIVMRAALESGADYAHYVDGDRLVRWIETQPDELRRTAQAITSSDCLVIGRTAAAFATHPLAQQTTEKLTNDVFSNVLGQALDFSAGSKSFSRPAVEFLLRNSPPSGVMGTDSEWIVLLHRAGYEIDAVEVAGLDWETADRYLDHAADAETQQRVAREYDADPQNWAFRVSVAQEIIDAGFAAQTRVLKQEKES